MEGSSSGARASSDGSQPQQTFSTATSVHDATPPVLSQRQLSELVKEVEATQVLDEDVEELLMQMADDFIEGVVSSSCQLARHRKSSTLDTKDLQLHLERAWNMSIPGFGGEGQLHKRSLATEAHKQRANLIKKVKR